MKKIKILFTFFLFVGFTVFFTGKVLACTVGDYKCESGALYDCECTALISGICYNTDWVKRVDCTYGFCRSSTACAQCSTTSYPTTCSDGVLKQCVRGVKTSTDCTYGYCRSSVACAQCSTTSGCTSSQVCVDGLCQSKTFGECGSANDQYLGAAPSGSALCSVGEASSVSYNSSTYGWSWTCAGTGSTKSCSASSNCAYNGGSCESASFGICPSGYYTVDTGTQFECSAACCKEVTCASLYGSNAECSSTCRDDYKLTSKGTGNDCSSGEFCCDSPNAKICTTDSFCQYVNTSDCYYCDTTLSPWNCEPKTALSHPTEVYDGVAAACGGSNNGSFCDRPSSGLCGTSNTLNWTDSAGTDGKWNWTCTGTEGGVCGGTDGGISYCSATNLPTVNGLCGTADGDNLTARPTTNLCDSGTANWSMTGTDSEGTDGTFDWKCTGSCGGSTDTCSAVNDLIPNITIDPVDIIDPDGVALTADAQGRNHSCEVDYGSGTVYQFLVTVTDANGLSDIDTVTLRFRPDSGNTVTTAAVIPNASGVATFNVDITGLEYKTYNLEVQAKDKHDPPGESSWMDTGRDFKVWDCLVGVNGTVYDGSADAGSISCSGNVGYTNTIPAASVFTLGYFLGTESPRMMTVSSPTFVDGGNKLYWNSPINYQSIFQDLPGSDPTQMRVNDSTCVSGVTLDPKLADPYAVSPSLKVEYSSVLDQDSWFSVVDGSVISAGKVINYVPVTCTTNCKTTINGVVLQSDPSSGLSNYDVTDSKFTGKSVNTGSYSYSILEPKYYSTLGIGTTITGSKKWSEINTSTGIIFVSGNLEIDENIAGSDFKVIIASGSITIDENVTQVKSTLMASSITAGGESNTPLTITGSLYSSGSIILSRSFIDKASNNETPAVKVVYDPRIIFNMPKELAKSVTQWKLN